MSAIAERERRFWDVKPASYDAVRALIRRAIGDPSRLEQDVRAQYDLRDRVVLDYGCGDGAGTLQLLSAGAAKVYGIDVSGVLIHQARERAAALGVQDRAFFSVGDAHATGLPEASFDLIVGGSILHHLDIPLAMRELRRILRPGGRAVFIEPLAHNPLLRLGRVLTPSARTRDEHPLTMADLRTCAQAFSLAQHHEREFLAVLVMPVNVVLPRRWQLALASRVADLDDRLLGRYPILRRYARVTILVLE